MTTSPLKVEELKPCPFCGRGDGVLFIRPSDNWRYMQCLSCLGSSGARADVESAIRAWNQRAAIVVELPDPHAHLIWIQAGHAPDDYWNDVEVSRSEQDKCCDGSDRYAVYAEHEVVEMLAAAGITVK